MTMGGYDNVVKVLDRSDPVRYLQPLHDSAFGDGRAPGGHSQQDMRPVANVVLRLANKAPSPEEMARQMALGALKIERFHHMRRADLLMTRYKDKATQPYRLVIKRLHARVLELVLVELQKLGLDAHKAQAPSQTLGADGKPLTWFDTLYRKNWDFVWENVAVPQGFGYMKEKKAKIDLSYEGLPQYVQEFFAG